MNWFRKIIIGFVLLCPSLVMAMQSSNYIIDDSIINSGGTTSTSASFHLLRDALGEPIVGQCDDGISVIQSGYYNNFIVPLPTGTPTATASATATTTVTPIRQFGGELIDEKWIYAAPHPVRGHTAHINIHLAEPADVEIKIYTTTNQLVLSENLDHLPAGRNYWDWNVSNLANGVYMVLIKAENGKITSIVKKKIAVIK